MVKLTEENVKKLAKSSKGKVIAGSVLGLILALNIISTSTTGKIAPLHNMIDAQNAQIASMQESFAAIEKSLSAMEASVNEIRMMNGADEMKATLADLASKSNVHDQALRARYDFYKAELERLNSLVSEMGKILGETPAAK